jgi:glucan 1,3-beta-glucosidase
MGSISIFALLAALRVFLLVSGAPAPVPIPAEAGTAAASSYWLSSISRQGTAAYGTAGYKVFRNVKDFGAVGDGIFVPS